MNFTIGKHKGKSVEIVILKFPDYIHWIIGKDDAEGPLLIVRNEVLRLLDIFDAKQFIVCCIRNDCERRATRVSLYRGNFSPAPWCDQCDPYSMGAPDGILSITSSYYDVLDHIRDTCDGNRVYYRRAIREMATYKGLPNRVGERHAAAFFHPRPD